MPPLRRPLLNVATLLSLLLCVAVVAMWVRSYAVADALGVRKTFGRIDNPERRFVNIQSADGGVRLCWGRRADHGVTDIQAHARSLGWGKGWRINHASSR